MRVHGPYKRKDGRQIVIVVENKGLRRTVSYPKWLMEVQLGRKLDPNLETVDHIDSNFDNNDLSNLRIVPRPEHSADDTRRAKSLKLKCAWCSSDFERSARLIRDKAKKQKAGPFCSRKCAGRYSRMLQLKLIDKFNPQEHVESEYYKRKYLEADLQVFSEEDIDINFEDLIEYAEGHLD